MDERSWYILTSSRTLAHAGALNKFTFSADFCKHHTHTCGWLVLRHCRLSHLMSVILGQRAHILGNSMQIIWFLRLLSLKSSQTFACHLCWPCPARGHQLAFQSLQASRSIPSMIRRRAMRGRSAQSSRARIELWSESALCAAEFSNVFFDTSICNC